MVRTVAALALLLTPAGAAAADYHLVIGGSPATGFAGHCTVDGARRKISGRIPSAGHFQAETVDCTLRKQDARGRLTAKLLKDGFPVARDSTAAAYGSVRVRSR